jgi:hypothetical protein
MPLAASITSKVSLTQFQPSWVTGLALSFYVLSSLDFHCIHYIFCPPDTDSRATRAISLHITLSQSLRSIFCPPDTDSINKPGHFSIHFLLSGWHYLSAPFSVPRTRNQEQAGPFLYTTPSLWLALSSLFCVPRTRTQDNL